MVCVLWPDGHKHGAPSCTEYKAACRALHPRDGKGVQELMRELLVPPLPKQQHATEHSSLTPGVTTVARHTPAILEPVRSKNKLPTAVDKPHQATEATTIDSMNVDSDIMPRNNLSKHAGQLKQPIKEVSMCRAPSAHSNSVASKIVHDLSLVIQRLNPDTMGDQCMSMSDTIALLTLAVLELAKLFNVTSDLGPVDQIPNADELAYRSSFPRLE